MYNASGIWAGSVISVVLSAGEIAFSAGNWPAIDTTIHIFLQISLFFVPLQQTHCLMSWKKTLLYFSLQTIRYGGSFSNFKRLWSWYDRWKNALRPGRNSVADELPWINFPALDFLESNIKPDFKVFEFGGGGSTLFFCKRTAEVITVEDHAEWFKTLTDMVQAKGYRNWRGNFISPEQTEDTPTRLHSNPNDFKSGAKGLENLSFERYARAIDPFPAEYFDLILVDGRARPSCIQQALPHLKQGGLLVVDNTERPYYLAPFRDTLAKDFEKMVEIQAPGLYAPIFTITSIYRKR